MPAPAVTRLAINGNSFLTAVGQTSQLTAVATFSDGSSQDATNDTAWSSNDPSILTVSTKGLVTVVRFGATGIQAMYRQQYGYVLIRATPPGTSTVDGSVREPGQGGSFGFRLPGVRILETQSGMATTTNGSGHFSFAGLTGAHLHLEKDGYETTETDAKLDTEVDIPMQRTVRLTAGETVTPVPLVPHDMAYTLASGDQCYPCRLIRINVPAAGMLHIRLTWTEPKAVLALWANGGQILRADPAKSEVDADVAVPAGELVVYVQQLPQASEAFLSVPFAIASSM
jgi:hypothetical protein